MQGEEDTQEVEAQNLARQKLALLAQLEEIDRRQLALATNDNNDEASDVVQAMLPRMTTARPTADRTSMVSWAAFQTSSQIVGSGRSYAFWREGHPVQGLEVSYL